MIKHNLVLLHLQKVQECGRHHFAHATHTYRCFGKRCWRNHKYLENMKYYVFGIILFQK